MTGYLPLFLLFATALCAGSVVLLWRAGHGKTTIVEQRAAAGLAVYADQLRELDQELEAGAITAAEAEGQRIEISRLLLAAGKTVDGSVPVGKPLPAWLVLVVPVVASALYLQIGRPNLADVPRAQRLEAARSAIESMQKGQDVAPETIDWPAGIALVEDRLAQNPNDLDGWRILIPNYLNTGRYGEAADAYANVIRIAGPTAELYANMAEAIVYQNRGLVSAQSAAINREALKLDAQLPKAQYYEGLALSQQGKLAEAKSVFTDLLARSPTDAPWRKSVERELANLANAGAAPNISAEQMQNAENMTAEQQTAMIRGMVDGLDEKLKDNPDDLDGWLRLIRARKVLGEADKALSALEQARRIFAGKPDKLKSVNDLSQELDMQ